MLNFEQPIALPRPLTLEERFANFVAENPRVVSAIVNLARARKRAGQLSWGMRACFETLRGCVDLVTTGEAVPGCQRKVRLNNSYTALMAHHVEQHFPDLQGFFRTRS